jgi:hypothetical protein
LNSYAFSYQNPVKYVDADGNNPIIPAIVRGLASLARWGYRAYRAYRVRKALEKVAPKQKPPQSPKSVEKPKPVEKPANKQGKTKSDTKSQEEKSRTAKDPLPRDKRTGQPKPDPEAEGTSHTQLGTKKGSEGDYKQVREFDKEGKPVRDIDFTDHGRPQNHPKVHQHKYESNPTGGTMKRGKAEPLN